MVQASDVSKSQSARMQTFLKGTILAHMRPSQTEDTNRDHGQSCRPVGCKYLIFQVSGSKITPRIIAVGSKPSNLGFVNPLEDEISMKQYSQHHDTPLRRSLSFWYPCNVESIPDQTKETRRRNVRFLGIRSSHLLGRCKRKKLPVAEPTSDFTSPRAAQSPLLQTRTHRGHTIALRVQVPKCRVYSQNHCYDSYYRNHV